MSRARDHFVGALHRFHGDDRLMFDRDRLPDVERRDLIGDAVAEFQILQLLLGRRARRQDTRPGEQRLNERGRIHQLDAVFLHHGRDRPDQPVGVPRHELRQHLPHLPVRDDAGKDLRVLHLARHHGLRDAGVLQQADALAEMPDRNPVDVGAGALRGVVQLGKRFFFRRDDGDVVALRTRGLEDQKGEASVAGNQAYAHDYSSASASSALRVARRRMTPRCDVRMKSTR